jgi:hypothetical protein
MVCRMVRMLADCCHCALQEDPGHLLLSQFWFRIHARCLVCLILKLDLLLRNILRSSQVILVHCSPILNRIADNVVCFHQILQTSRGEGPVGRYSCVFEVG